MRFFVETGRVDLGDLTREKPIGSGGAGDVYLHRKLPGRCVKLYKRDAAYDHAAAHSAKVRAMLANPPDLVLGPDGTVQMAWPQAAVLDERGDFRGFVMPFIDFQASWGMHQVLNPRLRRARQIPDAQAFRLTAATNLAFLVESLHQAGHNIIDVKPQNMRIYGSPAARAGFVALLDCDGFSISEGPGGQVYPATLATPEYAHPMGIAANGEGVDLDWMRRNPREQDLWAVAVLTFLLLNETHPLQGVPKRDFADYPTDLPTLTRRHAEVYAYGSRPNPRVEPKPDSQHEWFHPGLLNLFDRTFSGNFAIPPAREWRTALHGLLDPRQACPNDPNHWKLGDVCGQCARDRQLQVTALPTTQVAAPVRPSPRRRAAAPRAAAAAASGATVASLPKPYGMVRAWIVAAVLCLPFGLLAGGIAELALRLTLGRSWAELQAAALAAGLLLTFGLLRKRFRTRAARRGRPIRPAGLIARLTALVAGAGLLLYGLELGALVAGDVMGSGIAAPRLAQPPRPTAPPVRFPGTVAPAPASLTQVREVQQELARLGVYAGAIDGIAGVRTLEAIAALAGRGEPADRAVLSRATAGLPRQEETARLIETLRRLPTPGAGQGAPSATPAPPPATPSPASPSPSAPLAPQPAPAATPPARPAAAPPPSPAATIPGTLTPLALDGNGYAALLRAMNVANGTPGQPIPWSGGGAQAGTVLNLGPMSPGCNLVEITRNDIGRPVTINACRQQDGRWLF